VSRPGPSLDAHAQEMRKEKGEERIMQKTVNPLLTKKKRAATETYYAGKGKGANGGGKLYHSVGPERR